MTTNEISAEVLRLIGLIDDHKEQLTAQKKFNLQMMVGFAQYIEEVKLETDGNIPDFSYVKRMMNEAGITA